MCERDFSGVIAGMSLDKCIVLRIMSPLQGRSPPLQVKESYGNLDMIILQPGVYNVHLSIILPSEGLEVYRERTKKGQISKRKFYSYYSNLVLELI